MSRKKLATIVMALSLAAVALVGTTLAFFKDKTETAVNTFTVGNVKIDLLEPDWNPEEGKGLVPGATVKKDPFITNTGASDGFVMIHITGADAMNAVGFSAEYNTADWILVDEEGNARAARKEGQLEDGYYAYKKVLTAGDSTERLFTEVRFDGTEQIASGYQVIANFVDAKDGTTLFTYKDVDGNVIAANAERKPLEENGKPVIKYTVDGVTGEMFGTYEEAENYVLANKSEEASYTFDLKVQGFAIQTSGYEGVEAGSVQNSGGTYYWVPILLDDNQ